MKKTKVAVIRGKFLNKFELQLFEPLTETYDLLGVGSKTAFDHDYSFPVVRLSSPVDIPNFPFKMSILNRLFIDANYLFGLDKVIKGYDIVHPAESYYHFTIQSLNAKRKGLVKKVVVSVYENIPFAGEGIWGRKKFKKRVYKEADHIIAVSNKSKSALIKEGCSPKKITVITQHIDTARFIPSKKVNNSKNLTILFTGRLEEYKGVYDFIDTARLLLKDSELSHFQLIFKLVGTGSQKDKLLNMIQDKGIHRHFQFDTLSYHKMPNVYQDADIYIAPSKTTKHWQEQFSTVLLEAKSSGLPIVSTKTGGIPENVGKAGFLVREGDYQGIARFTKILVLSPELRIKMGTAARSDALKRFTIEQGAEKLKRVYRRVLAS